MSGRYHIGRDGEPKRCSAASEESCPLGGTHYDSMDAAYESDDYKRAHSLGNDGSSLRKSSGGYSDDTTLGAARTMDSAQSIIEDYGLDYGNSEIEDWTEQNREVSVTVEAPNHATIDIDVPTGATREQLLGAMAERMGGFNADEQFDTLYEPNKESPENEYTPTQFMNMLIQDEDYYRQAAEAMSAELATGEHNGFTYSRQAVTIHGNSYPVNDGDPVPRVTVNADADAEDRAADISEQFQLNGDTYHDYDWQGKKVIVCEFRTPEGYWDYKQVPEHATQQELLRALADRMDEFNADEEYVYLPSDRNTTETPSETLWRLHHTENYLRYKAHQLRAEADRLDSQQ